MVLPKDTGEGRCSPQLRPRSRILPQELDRAGRSPQLELGLFLETKLVLVVIEKLYVKYIVMKENKRL